MTCPDNTDEHPLSMWHDALIKRGVEPGAVLDIIGEAIRRKLAAGLLTGIQVRLDDVPPFDVRQSLVLVTVDVGGATAPALLRVHLSALEVNSISPAMPTLPRTANDSAANQNQVAEERRQRGRPRGSSRLKEPDAPYTEAMAQIVSEHPLVGIYTAARQVYEKSAVKPEGSKDTAIRRLVKRYRSTHSM